MYKNNPTSTVSRESIIFNQNLDISLRGIYSSELYYKEIPVGNSTNYNSINESSKISSETREYCKTFSIRTLIKKQLREPIDALVEHDENQYISRTIDFPLYANGKEPYEAIQNLRFEIESLYYELNEDDNFSDEWLSYKSVLKRIIK